MQVIALQQTSRRRKANRKSPEQKWNQLLFWFTFLMAFPSVLLFGQNISVFIFAGMVLFLFRYKKGPVFNLQTSLQWFAVFFGLSAVLSVANIPQDAAPDSLDRAMAVLPNYLYWSLLIIFLVTQKRLLNLEYIYKGIFWGLSITVIYYLFLQQLLFPLPIFNQQSPNNFAFILICYAPIAVYYLMEKKGKAWAISFFSLLVLILLRDGRRAGVLLVILGGLAVLYAAQISWKNVLAVAIIVLGFVPFKNISAVEAFILHSSERVHEMLYETDKIRKEDRSYLTRVAMVKKGLAILEKFPYTGVGLNNFSNYTIDFDKSFEGARYIVYKENLQLKSAHNSYIALLSEGGIFLLTSFLLILTSCVLYPIYSFFKIQPIHRPVYIGIIVMTVHLYFVSAIVNVYAWFLIALACALVNRK